MCKNIAQRANKRNRKQNKINAFSLIQLLASRRPLVIEMLVETSWNIESAEKKFKPKWERKICGKFSFILIPFFVVEISCWAVFLRLRVGSVLAEALRDSSARMSPAQQPQRFGRIGLVMSSRRRKETADGRGIGLEGTRPVRRSLYLMT